MNADEVPVTVIARTARSVIEELTGKPATGVAWVEPGEGGWFVGVEVLEDHRVPSTADVLGLYEAEIGAGGDLLAYRRLRQYQRGRGDTGGSR
jgi:Gas vesicle synthesis protein GvpO